MEEGVEMLNSTLIIQEILDRLRGVEKKEDGYIALCPCHNDRNNPNLQISIKADRILIYCFACGANGKAVMEKIGLSVSMLFFNSQKHGQRGRI